MEKMKERIFGFVVVLALGVIFIPMLFTNSHKQMHLAKELPAKPTNKDSDNTQPKVLSDLKAQIRAKQEEQIAHQEVIKEAPQDAKEENPKLAQIDQEQKIKEKQSQLDKEQALKQAQLAKEQAAAKQAQLAKEQAAAKQAQLAKEQAALKQAQLAKEQEALKQAQLAKEQEALKQAQLAKEQAAAKQAQLAKEQEALKQAQLAKEQAAAKQAQLAKEQAAAKQAQLAKEQAAAKQAQLAKEQAAVKEVQLAKEQAAKEVQLAKEQAAKEEKAKQITLAKAHENEPKIQSLDESNNGAVHKDNKSSRKLEQKLPKEKVFAQGGNWAVQLGTFAYPEHASTLLKKLKAQGLPAYTRKTNRSGETLTVVFVGPMIRKEDASKLISTLESRYQLRGIIVRYGIVR